MTKIRIYDMYDHFGVALNKDTRICGTYKSLEEAEHAAPKGAVFICPNKSYATRLHYIKLHST